MFSGTQSLISPLAIIGSLPTVEVAFLEGKPLVAPLADRPLAISKLAVPSELAAPLAASLAASRLAVLVVAADKQVEGELLAFLLLTF